MRQVLTPHSLFCAAPNHALRTPAAIISQLHTASAAQELSAWAGLSLDAVKAAAALASSGSGKKVKAKGSAAESSKSSTA